MAEVTHIGAEFSDDSGNHGQVKAGAPVPSPPCVGLGKRCESEVRHINERPAMRSYSSWSSVRVVAARKV